MIGAGTFLGDFQVISQLGQSGLGELYKAKDPISGRLAALQILPSNLVTNPDRVQKFQDDASAATALGDPHIVSVYEIGGVPVEGQPVYYIAMEMVEGKTLREKLDRQAALSDTLEWLADVADTLGRAHAAGLVHRNLNPESIMITRSGRVKVLGFGLANLVEPLMPRVVESSSIRLRLATDAIAPGYMSPEQLDERVVGPRTDIFSFGCILYEALTGRPAFRGDSAVETMHAVINDEPDYTGLLDYPRYITRKCLQKKPENRYSSFADLARDLRVMTPTIAPRRAGLAHRVAAMLLVIAAITGSFIVRAAIRQQIWPEMKPPPPIDHVTYTGDVVEAEISPDETYLAMVREGATRRLVMKQLATGLETQIRNHLAAGDDVVGFSQDGTSVFYLQSDPITPNRIDLHRTSIFGGGDQVIARDVASAPAASADGRSIAFTRCADTTPPAPRECKLIVATSDGSNERDVLTRSGDLTAPSWSPDGQTIAVEATGPTRERQIVGVRVADGTSRVLAAGRARSPRWADSDRLLFIRPRAGSGTGEPWLLEIRSGSERLLTRDGVDYTGCSVSADGRRLYTVAAARTRSIWTMMPANAQSLQRITPALPGVTDGLSLSWTADGRLVHERQSDKTELWIIGSDGSNPRLLTSEALPSLLSGEFDPVCSPVTPVAAIRSRGRGVALLRLDDASLTPVTSNNADFHFRWSPDGSRLYFAHVEQPATGERLRGVFVASGATWRVEEVRTGTSIITAMPVGVTRDALIVLGGAESGDIPPDRLARVPLNGSAPVTLPTPPGISPETIQLTPDLRSVVWLDPAGTLWRATLGETRAVRVAQLPAPQKIRSYAFSRDGRTLALTIDNPAKSDVVKVDLPEVTARREASAN